MDFVTEYTGDATTVDFTAAAREKIIRAFFDANGQQKDYDKFKTELEALFYGAQPGHLRGKNRVKC